MPWDPMKPGSSVCVCHEVGHNQCRDLVLEGRVACMADLTRLTAAGSSCSLCVPYFEKIIRHYLAVGERAVSVSTEREPLVSTEREPLVSTERTEVTE